MHRRKLIAAFFVILFALLAQVALVWGDGEGKLVRGAGTTIVTGGTGAPSFDPVLTKFGFHWRDGQGRLSALPSRRARRQEPRGAGTLTPT